MPYQEPCVLPALARVPGAEGAVLAGPYMLGAAKMAGLGCGGCAISVLSVLSG